ncbi:mannose-1-phosphate guanylyltransferase [Candidatus Collierbacteria bacterium]|nr:mannose-1-phosphate guanylyltransferase [Candidatus Collierbacteria bacterium]
MDQASNKHLFAVILAGGGGTRLWPRSTNAKPKQFLRLISDKTMLQETLSRIIPIIPPERVLVITNSKYKTMVEADLPSVPSQNIFAEPEKKDTAMAMGVGAIIASKIDPEAVIINLAADHVVKDEKEFRRTMLAAANAALTGDFLVTVGISPTFPHTGLGYIRIRDKINDINGLPVYRVTGFTEKPKEDKAKEFLATGKYFWNANNYVWTAKSALESFKKHLPKTYSQLVKLKTALGGKDINMIAADVYAETEAISIDYGVSEKAGNLLLVPGDFGWSDIGDWQVVYDLSTKDKSGNVIDQSRGIPPILIDVKGCFVCGGKKLLAAVGVEDMIMVETKKAVLIVPKNKAQSVKHIVEWLKEKGMTEYL